MRYIVSAGLILTVAAIAALPMMALRGTDSAHPSPIIDIRPAVELAAEKSGREFLRRLANVCRQQSAKSDEWKSYADVYDFGNAGEIEARKAFEEFEAAMDAALNPNAPTEPGKASSYDPAAVRRIFGQAATGFDRAAGIKSGEKSK